MTDFFQFKLLPRNYMRKWDRLYLGKEADARALIRELLVSSADIVPDSDAKTLTVRVHRMTTAAHDTAVSGLLAKLTAEEFTHPQTGLRMVYELV
jgi:hypothetical protein